MSGARRVVGNLSMVASAHVVVLAATILFTVAQARYLGPERFGEISLALSLSIIFGSFTDFGLGTQLARAVAQQPDRSGVALGSTLVVSAALWASAMPIVLLATIVLGYSAELRTSVLILAASLLFGSASAVLSAYFQGREDFRVRSLAPVVRQLSVGAIGIVVLALGGGIVAVAMVIFFGALLNLAILVLGLSREGLPRIHVDRSSIWVIFIGAIPIGLFWTLGATYYNIGVLLLQKLLEPEQVGWYAAAYRLFTVAGIVPALVSGVVLYPVLARLSVDPGDALRAAMARAFRFLLIAGVFVTLVFVVLADQIVGTIYSTARYSGTAEVLRLLAPALATQYIGSVFQFGLLAMRHERRLLVMAAFLAVANPLVNLWVIPRWQQDGAALVTVATEMIVLAWLFVATPARLRSAVSVSALARTAVAAVPAAALLLLLRDQHVVVAVAVAGVTYVATALATGVFPKEDRRLLRSIAPRRWAETPTPASVYGPRT